MVALLPQPQIPGLLYRAKHHLIRLIESEQFIVIDFRNEWDFISVFAKYRPIHPVVATALQPAAIASLITKVGRKRSAS